MEKKSLVSYIYIGSPTQSQQATFGTKARIQLNDVTFSRKVGEIQNFINGKTI